MKEKIKKKIKGSNKIWGFRGMNSIKASKVKRAGHEAENTLAALINVPAKNIITGTGKIDLINKDGKSISLKSSHDKKGRSQICLYSYSSNYFKRIINGSTKRIKECLAVFPEKKEEYRSNRIKIKRLLQPKMIELKRYINASKKNKKEFLNFIFFTDYNGKKVDFLVITDHLSNFFVFTANEVVDIFCKNTIVLNSIARNIHETPNLKVLFKGKNEKGKYVNLIENEIRTSTHYRRFLSVGNKLKYLYVLLSNVSLQKRLKNKLVLCGKANKTFSL